MAETDLNGRELERIFVRAYDVASSYDLVAVRKAFEKNPGYKLVEGNPLLVQSDPRKTLAVFDYGAIVFFEYSGGESREVIAWLNPYAVRLNKVVSEDEFTLTIASKARAPEGTDELFVKEFNRDIALLVGTVLSRSVSLEYYEKLVANALANLEQPIESLQYTGKIPRRERELTKRVGFALAVEQELAHTLSVFDDPDIVWNGGKRIDELYTNLKKQFDLDNRIKVIEQKVSIISRSTTFIISRVESQRSRVLEWIIILLILLEIILVIAGKL